MLTTQHNQTEMIKCGTIWHCSHAEVIKCTNSQVLHVNFKHRQLYKIYPIKYLRQQGLHTF